MAITTEIIPLVWSNLDNARFYETISIQDFQQFASLSGIAEAIDVNTIFPYLKDSQSLLEMNAGYGRVIDALLLLGFPGRITAIERNNLFVRQMKLRLPAYINIIHDDILAHNFKNPFDSILIMWSCITEFNPHEQQMILKRFSNLLTPNGKIFLDLIDEQSILTHVTFKQDRYLEVKTEEAVERFYLPTISELNEWIQAADLIIHQALPYSINDKIKRVCYILAKV